MAEDNSTPTRICKLCKGEFPATLEYFNPHKMGKYGLHTHCRPCKKIADAESRARPDQKARQQAWRDANKEKVKEYNADYRAAGYKSTEHVRAWYHANLEKARAYGRKKQAEIRRADPVGHLAKVRRNYYASHDKALARARRYLERNRSAVNAKAVARQKEKYRNEPWFNLKVKFAARLKRLLVGKAGRTTLELLGYSREELVSHIEKQFTKGMNWERVFAGEIHIDHIVPVSSFNISGADDPALRECWALSNLRPLWAKDNLSKQAKREFLL